MGCLYPFSYGGYHFMIFVVNKHLSPEQRIPHSLHWGGWNQLKQVYGRMYPNSVFYSFVEKSTWALFASAAAFCVLRAWEYAGGTLP